MNIINEDPRSFVTKNNIQFEEMAFVHIVNGACVIILTCFKNFPLLQRKFPDQSPSHTALINIVE